MNFDQAIPYTVLIGNPNCGKTAIFNQLTGMDQKVSNYPGVTVERKEGKILLNENQSMTVIDMPGSYSIAPESFDERIVTEQVFSWLHTGRKPEVIISVVDASNLSRNLYLTSQLLDLGIPVILALNMMDRLKLNKVAINVKSLQEKLELAAVIPMVATDKKGVAELKDAIRKVKNQGSSHGQSFLPFDLPGTVKNNLQALTDFLKNNFKYPQRAAESQSLRLVSHKTVIDLYTNNQIPGADFQASQLDELVKLRTQAVSEIEGSGYPHQTLEATYRYGWLDGLTSQISEMGASSYKHESRSEKVDRILTHPAFGPLIFISILYFIFHSIFSWATIPMDWLDLGIHSLSQIILNNLTPSVLRDLLVDGIIGGVGAIIVFLPQILILVFFLTLLEDSGYMARVAFMMDRFMNRIGLHGKSVLPLMSGYACAIPGIMATRTIDSWKERLITILILPLMSCSARLPIYTLLIGAFIPSVLVLGFISLQGLTMVFMYFLGTATALLLAMVFSRFIKIEGKSTFVMEIPPYRVPLMRSVIRQVYIRGKLFLFNAGKIIMAISIVLWFLAYFPRDLDENAAQNSIENSYAGKIGHALEPVIKPLGYDWKIGVGLIASFAAREVVISTLATIYNVEGKEEGLVNLSEAMQADINPRTGKKRYGLLMALSLMVFYVFAAQCMATFAIVRSETNSWRWPLFMVVYMTGLAYFLSFIVFQAGTLIGMS